MRNNIKEVIEKAAARPSQPLDSGAILRRGRNLRYQRRIIAVVSSLAVVGVAIFAVTTILPGFGRESSPRVAAASEGSSPSNPELGYEVANRSVSLGRQGKARVEFLVSWDGNAFPGVVSCSVTVRNEDGKPIGEKTISTLSTTTPENAAIRTGVAVDGLPSLADVECGERLDDPDGTYEMTNVRVERPSPESDELLVFLDSRWTGSTDTPGVSDCSVSVYASDESLLLEDQLTYSAGRFTEDVPLSLTLPSDVARTPTSAQVVCSPLGDLP